MKNKQSTMINKPKKAYRSTSTIRSQDGLKKVTKLKRSGCCMGGSLKK